MSHFLTTALGYPTLLYSAALVICMLYWLLAATGLVDIDGLELPDGSEAEGLAGIFARLGLDRVPMMVVLTVVALFAWIITYFVHLFMLAPLWGWLRWLLGTVTALLALVPAALLTAVVLRPVRRWLIAMQPPEPASLSGRMAVVRSPVVTDSAGMADLDDGGAGLVLQVRCEGCAPIRRGERVVLLEYLPQQHAWRVLPEQDYRRL